MSVSKKAKIKDIQAKIAKLEQERDALLPLRKEEIFNVLEASGGLSLDNSILAGIALYANSVDGKDSEFLQALKKIGKNYLPRHSKYKDSDAVKGAGEANILEKKSFKEKKANG